MDHDLPDREEIACALDVLEVRLARQGQYDQAADVNSARRLLRAADEEIAAKDARIAELEAFATEQNRERTEAIGACQERIAQLEAENEALRADVVWLLAHKMIGYGDRISYAKEPRSWSLRKELDHDGTPDGILRAVREAREG